MTSSFAGKPSEDSRPVAAILGRDPLASVLESALEQYCQGQFRVDDAKDDHPLAPTAYALSKACSLQARRVLLVPSRAIGLDHEDLAAVLSNTNPAGCIATDGVRDVFDLAFLPTARASEASALVRSGGQRARFFASIGRVYLSDRALMGIWPASR